MELLDLIILFISIAVLITISVIIIHLIEKQHQKQERAIFAAEEIKKQEQIVKSFFETNNIEPNSHIRNIVADLNLELKFCKSLPDHDVAELEDKTIKVLSSDGIKEQNFDIAHEIAHVIKGDKVGARKKHSIFRIRSYEEQVLDYMAAAILLPMDELLLRMSKSNYHQLKKFERIKFIDALAEEKDISDEVVLRRIIEATTIFSN